MKAVKGKFLKKLNPIKTIGYLKPERILQINASNVLIDQFFAKSSNKIETLVVSKDLEDDDVGSGSGSDTESVVEDKENHCPLNDPITDPIADPIDIGSFRPPDLDSTTLFDPNLLAAFRQAVLEAEARLEERRKRVLLDIGNELDEDREPDGEPPLKWLKLDKLDDPLSEFEKICPPGGSDSVILYTTGLRTIRKTFEECSSIRFLLDSFRVMYHERDLSMHLDFRDELLRLLGTKVVPPKLFVNGRYIGGAEEVLRLHERGEFRPLLAGIPVRMWEGPCEGCAGVGFVVCWSCRGSRKVNSGEGSLPEKCRECNENGLVFCPFCS